MDWGVSHHGTSIRVSAMSLSLTNLVCYYTIRLAEDHVGGGSLGELSSTIIKMQFEALMRGDPLFYLNDPDLESIAGLNGMWNAQHVNLGEVLRQNTFMKNSETKSPFFV